MYVFPFKKFLAHALAKGVQQYDFYDFWKLKSCPAIEINFKQVFWKQISEYVVFVSENFELCSG